MASQEISKNDSNDLMGQQLLRSIYYYVLFFFLILKRFICFCFVVIYHIIIIISFISRIIYFIFIIIPPTFWCHRKTFTIFYQFIHPQNNIKILFDKHHLNGLLFLRVSFVFLLLAFPILVKLILPFTTIHTSL